MISISLNNDVEIQCTPEELDESLFLQSIVVRNAFPEKKERPSEKKIRKLLAKASPKSQKSLVKELEEFYQSSSYTRKDINEKLGLSESSQMQYLWRGGEHAPSEARKFLIKWFLQKEGHAYFGIPTSMTLYQEFVREMRKTGSMKGACAHIGQTPEDMKQKFRSFTRT